MEELGMLDDGSKDKLIELLKIPKVDAQRQYWLVRADSGELWEEFKAENFIAIGWNEIFDSKKLSDADSNPEIEDELRKTIKNKYDTSQPGRVINTIKRFYFDMKIGDIVMIPSEGSNIITFAEVSSDFYIKQITVQDIDEGKCDFKKRRDFIWLKDVNRSDLDPLLFKMFQAHQTICNANSYAAVIDRTLKSLYIKDGIVHLKIDVKVPNDIKAKKLFNLQNLILNCEHYEISDEVKMKINIQSNGFIELITKNISDILTTLFILQIVIGGGKFKDYETVGILSFIKSCKEKKEDMELEREKLELEKNKFKFEKEMGIVNQIKEIYGDKIKELNIEIPNEVLENIVKINRNLNSDLAISEEEDSKEENEVGSEA